MASCVDTSVYEKLCFLILLNENVLKNPSASQRVKELSRNLLLNHVQRIVVQTAEIVADAVEERETSHEIYHVLWRVLPTYLGKDFCLQKFRKLFEDMSKEDRQFLKDLETHTLSTKISSTSTATTSSRAKASTGSKEHLLEKPPVHQPEASDADTNWRQKLEEFDGIIISSFQSIIKDKNPFESSFAPAPTQLLAPKPPDSSWKSILLSRREEPLSSLVANIDDLFSEKDLIPVFEQPLNDENSDSPQTPESPKDYEGFDCISIDESVINERLGLTAKQPKVHKSSPIRVKFDNLILD